MGLLCVPTVMGPVNELMKHVRVKGCIPGADVVVETKSGKKIAAGKAGGSGVDNVPLTVTALERGQALLARQELGVDASPPSPDQLAIVVGPAPAVGDLGFIGARSHLYACGQALWLTGAYPGATVEVEFSGGVQGRATAEPDGARVRFSAGLPEGQVRIRQVIPAGKGPDTVLNADRAPVDFKDPLPTPTVKRPLIGCQTAVLVTDVFDGANVTLTRSGSSPRQSLFDMSALWFRLPEPLKKGEKIHASQRFDRCEHSSGASPDQEVSPPEEVPVPIVSGPLCTAGVCVRVDNLIPGALVLLDVNGQIYARFARLDASWDNFYFAPLGPGKVSAAQEICSKRTVYSKPEPILNVAPVNTKAEIRGPLVACGRAIHVSKAHPGAQLEAWAEHNGVKAPISEMRFAQGTDLTINVTPFLRQGDKVWVKQFGCSATSTESARLEVEPPRQPSPPTVSGKVYAGAPTVTLAGVVPGAKVELFLTDSDGQDEHPAGSRESDGEPVVVGVRGTLRRFDRIGARQTICGVETRILYSASVVAPPPATPVDLRPVNGSTGVGAKPTFTWKDPGAGTEAAASKYEIKVTAGSTVVTTLIMAATTSWTPPTNLPADGKVSFQIRAINETGTSQIAQTVVSVAAAPSPVAPTLDGYDTTAHRLTGHGFVPGQDVYVRLVMHGNSVLNSFGEAVPDGRDSLTKLPQVKFKAGADGKISVVVLPRDILPELFLDYVVGSIWGVMPGEIMHWTAHDERKDPADLTGALWSAPLNVLTP